LLLPPLLPIISLSEFATGPEVRLRRDSPDFFGPHQVGEQSQELGFRKRGHAIQPVI
jgi:hypothetical protein